MPATQIAVQSAHAAIEAAHQFLPEDHPHPHLVLCRVSSERDLLAVADRLDRAGIRFTLFREPDRNDEVTALATEPLGPDRRGVLARYPCLTRSDLLSAPSSAESR
ncbi:MAG: peptidyl-tRNA hydrolase [Planctomycetia bacterium]|nr:peptidyl-tRNA hydrolase [Planctomycetia bacterium]